jgi:flavin reductase (DIM6/NTAB) family NADH-FMN oxidoreductase RutF
MTDFKKIDNMQINENVFRLIGKDWMLITAGNLNSYNMMTASWGGMGVLWNKQIAICFIRPQRYTYEFVEKNDLFTISFFEETHRPILSYLGTESGRTVNKMRTEGLTPLSSENNSVYFKEAKLVLECRKLYFDDINADNFLNAGIDKLYPIKDYHRMYFGEIITCLEKNS